MTWTAPASNGGSAITHYTVTSDPGGVVTDTTGGLGVVVPALTAGTSYTFTVYATNAAGNGPSATSNAVTPYNGPACDAMSMIACPSGSVCALGGYSACASPSFSASSGVVVDSNTGLVWQQSAPTTTTFDWDSTANDPASAQYYCENLSLGPYTSGWRLPTVGELFSIIYAGTPEMIDATYFPNTLAGGYWSSTSDPSDVGTAWLICFDITGCGPYGVSYNYMVSATNGVRCVYGQ